MLLAAAGCSLAATVGMAPPAQAASCSGGTAQVYRDGFVRVYRQGSQPTYACIFSTGRRSRLFDNATGFRRAGKYLAYYTLQPRNVGTNPGQCLPNDQGTSTLCITLTESKNLLNGTVVWGASFATEGQAPPSVRKLALRSSDGKYGAIIGSGVDTKVIRARGLGGYDQLDSGSGITAGSLSATTSQLVWRSSGARRSAPLGPRDTTPPPQSQSCTERGTTPEYIDAEVRVFFDNSSYVSKVCRFRTGRRFTLLGGSYGYQRAGNYLLYQSSSDRFYCYSASQVKLESKSLLDGVLVAEDTVNATAAANDCPRIQTVLRASDGAFAYMADPLAGQPVRVVAARRAGNAILDPGPGNEYGSLLLSGSTLTWRKNGAAQTATL